VAPRTDESVGAAIEVSGRIASLSQPAVANALSDAATASFLHGLSIGCLVAGAVAAGGAILAALFLPAQPPVKPPKRRPS